ncbi:Pol polyprotein [Plakobranchus ocellatus]|uniref:Pol polyprotein n=1 Tax=Plakobranchus ocellatus TaxID=259542 RepID=A0AAV4CQY5_9GAST|nr:Pol polyprotein [Plakobranchus ocellatus]
MNDQQAESLRSLLAEYQDVFAKSDFDLGNFTAVYHTVATGKAAPIKQRMRLTPIHFKGEEDTRLDKMLEAGVVQPSVSEWASPPVLVRKRDGSVRCCVDYRALNKITRKDVFLLPCIEDCVDASDGNLWFSKLDANSAYWQVRLDEESKRKTAFCTRRGLFEFVRMPFGLCNAPATFSRVINLVLSDLNWESVLAFLDDVCVLGRSYDDHIDNFRKVFERFRTYGLRLKPRKCSLFRREVEYLGRLVSRNGIQILPESIAVVQEWPVPRTVKDIQRFMRLTNLTGEATQQCGCIVRIPHVEECSSYTASILLTSLPCGGCKYCQRMQRSWGESTEEVDYVIPLSSAVRSLAQQGPMAHIAEEQ